MTYRHTDTSDIYASEGRSVHRSFFLKCSRGLKPATHFESRFYPKYFNLECSLPSTATASATLRFSRQATLQSQASCAQDPLRAFRAIPGCVANHVIGPLV